MGNSVSRPSCLGEKSPREEDVLKEPCSATRNKEEEDGAGPSEKACLSPRVLENGWKVALEGAGKNSPLPKQNNLDVKLQNCSPIPPQPEGAVAPWTSPKSLGAAWGWKPSASREVTEVTEVTETVVTEIVEVTEYPGGDKSREAAVTRTVKVLADVRGALAQVNRHRAPNFTPSAQSPGTGQEAVGQCFAYVLCPPLPICSRDKMALAQLGWAWLLRGSFAQRGL